MHVRDVAQALLAAVGQAGVFNVSTGVETTVSRIFELLRTAADVTLEGELAPLRAGELERSCIDPGRAREQLGWRPEIGVEEGLATTYRALTDEFELEPRRVRRADRVARPHRPGHFVVTGEKRAGTLLDSCARIDVLTRTGPRRSDRLAPERACRRASSRQQTFAAHRRTSSSMWTQVRVSEKSAG